MRVMHVSQPTTEGVAVVVSRLVADQVARGWTVFVACPAPSWLADRATQLGANVLAWDSVRSPTRGLLAESRDLRALMAEAAPDIVHLHSAKAGLSGRLALRGRTPTAFQPHAWSFHAASLARPAAVFWERTAARWSDVTLVVSRDEMHEGLAAGVDTRYAIVPNGVPARPPIARDDARQRLRLGPGPAVVCVGRLSRQKGQDRLLAIWPSVLKEAPDAQLYLVGDGPLRPKLESAAPPGVHFCGTSDQVAVWLAAAVVVALPSRWEAGSSLALLEAMEAGRSVVATKVAGVGDAVRPGTGAVVPQESLKEFREQLIRRLVRPDLADEEGAAGREWVERSFSSSELAHRVGDLYPSLLQ